MRAFQWFTELTKQERRTFYAGFGGYAVDAFDFMIYPFLIPTLLAAWNMSHSQAGMIATSALISSAVGGWLAGILSDRYGRIRVLQWTIITFSIFTCLSGFTNSFWQLLVTRTLQGIGFGGEWSVVTVMMAEMTRSPQHRGKMVGTVQSSWAVGWGFAAALYWVCFSLLPEQYAWRMCFWVGLLPALWIVYIRRYVHDAEIYLNTRRAKDAGLIKSHFLQIFSRQHLKTTLLCCALSTGMLGGNFAITTWLPTYLKNYRHLSVLNTTSYMIVLIVGSFVGGVVGAMISDHIGRRKAFILFSIGCFVCTISYMLLPVTDSIMLSLGFPLGLVMQGVFSGVGAYFSELYPNTIRGSSQGFCYNFGRGLASVFPILIGILSESISLVSAMGIVAGVCYFSVIIAAICLPETQGKLLE